MMYWGLPNSNHLRQSRGRHKGLCSSLHSSPREIVVRAWTTSCKGCLAVYIIAAYRQALDAEHRQHSHNTTGALLYRVLLYAA